MRFIGLIVGGVALAGIFAFIFGYFVMLLWNWLMPDIFGLTEITDREEYRIIKLKDKRGGEPIEFSVIVDTLKKIVVKKNFNKMLSKYLAKLRVISKIRINKKSPETHREKILERITQRN